MTTVQPTLFGQGEALDQPTEIPSDAVGGRRGAEKAAASQETALDGFMLERMEMFNWGNLAGLSVVNVAPPDATKPNSMMIGVNGSGKSTTADAWATLLLPYQQKVRYGNVDGSDRAKGGRTRTLREYVLGKHSNQDEETAASSPERMFNRKTGFTALVAVFRQKDAFFAEAPRYMSIARCWWYADYEIKEAQAYITAACDLSIKGGQLSPLQTRLQPTLVDRDGKYFARAAALKGHLATFEPECGVRFHETADPYFDQIQATFGADRETIALLLRAKDTKKIDDIDRFVREDMLPEPPGGALPGLISAVDTAMTIFASIELIKRKVKAGHDIVRSLEAEDRLYGARAKTHETLSLARVYQHWDVEQRAIKEADASAAALVRIADDLPRVETKIASLRDEKDEVQRLLDNSKTGEIIRGIEQEMKLARADLAHAEAERRTLARSCQEFDLAVPETHEGHGRLLGQVKDLLDDFSAKSVRAQDELGEMHVAVADAEKQAAQARGELEHLERHKTNIPRAIYQTKLEIAEALGIANSSLMFVGELLDIAPGEERYMQAAEAVLAPIARNILCHPDDLDRVTEHLNHRYRGQSVVTMKRISPAELRRPAPSWKTLASESILRRLAFRPAKEHPFTSYMMHWLVDSFDYQVVALSDFGRDGVQRGVTLEGLVKQDSRTQRKAGASSARNLGWSPEAKKAALIGQLLDLDARLRSMGERKRAIQAEVQKLQDAMRRLETLLELKDTYLGVHALDESLADLARRLAEVKAADPDLGRAKDRILEIQAEILRLDTALKTLIGARSEAVVTRARALADAERERQTYVALAASSPLVPLEAEALARTMASFAETHLPRDKTLSSLMQALDASVRDIQAKIEASQTKSYLQKYRQEWPDDTELHFDHRGESTVAELLIEWREWTETLLGTGLVEREKAWHEHYVSTLIETVKNFLTETRVAKAAIKKSIDRANAVLRGVNYENLPGDKRYIQIREQGSTDDRVRRFNQRLNALEKIIATAYRGDSDEDTKRREAIAPLERFVAEMKDEQGYQDFVTDVRNHFRFSVQAFRRSERDGEPDASMEVFRGNDGKSGGQTLQITYALITASLSHRLGLREKLTGRDALRSLFLDEFANNLDSEKPHAVVQLLNDMGFQTVFILPMTKADIMAEHVGTLTFVHKKSQTESCLKSYPIELYDEIRADESFRSALAAEGEASA